MIKKALAAPPPPPNKAFTQSMTSSMSTSVTGALDEALERRTATSGRSRSSPRPKTPLLFGPPLVHTNRSAKYAHFEVDNKLTDMNMVPLTNTPLQHVMMALSNGSNRQLYTLPSTRGAISFNNHQRRLQKRRLRSLPSSLSINSDRLHMHLTR